jgi:hypothetical protein
VSGAFGVAREGPARQWRRRPLSPEAQLERGGGRSTIWSRGLPTAARLMWQLGRLVCRPSDDRLPGDVGKPLGESRAVFARLNVAILAVAIEIVETGHRVLP